MADWFDIACGLWLLGSTLAGLLALMLWLSRRPNPADDTPPAFLVGRSAPQRQRLPALLPTPAPMDVNTPAYDVALYAASAEAAVAADDIRAEVATSELPVAVEDTTPAPTPALDQPMTYEQWLEWMRATWQNTPVYEH